MFGFQGCRLFQFTVEDVTFDYNMRRGNMDGIHLNGPCRHGRVSNLKGATNDDMVALNADDGAMAEPDRGPIEDIQVDGLWAENGYTAVRLLSAGSPVRRVRISNVFDTFRFNVVSFTNHKVHPGTASTFDDVVIDGVFCSKAAAVPPMNVASWLAQIWIDAPAVVSSLILRNYHRTETAVPVDDIHVEAGACVEHLLVDGAVLRNRSAGPIVFLHNRGRIRNLALRDVMANAETNGGRILANTGAIDRLQHGGVAGVGFEAGSETA